MKPSAKQDREHLKTGYALLKEALDELMQVYQKDRIMAHAVRVLGEVEDNLYEVITSQKGA